MPTEVSKGLSIAEVFSSIQGEGTWVGTPMRFIRLVGCPVGKKATDEWMKSPTMEPSSIDHPMLPVFTGSQSACKTWDGRFFPCDTDFSYHTYKTVDELIGETWEKHICLTGGEPLIHQKSLIEQGFFQLAFHRGIQIHIETSGTIMIHHSFEHDNRVWLTVSPKFGVLHPMLLLADEIKLLVDEEWDEANLLRELQLENIRTPVFVSPINGEKEVNQENVKLALTVLRSHPTWRLSAQWHKFLNLR
jgi:7-carboxy-7-deazaguanine synthase